jgi:hypothetical protein
MGVRKGSNEDSERKIVNIGSSPQSKQNYKNIGRAAADI